MVHVEHVKGEGTYGMPRNVLVFDDSAEILKKYLDVRAARLKRHGKTSKAMFPPIFSENEYYQQQSFGRLKKCVEEALGVGFEIRAGRRSFGQRRIDQGNDSDVSYAMGHSTTKATERYYGRVKESSVNERMLAMDRARDIEGRPRTGGDAWVRTAKTVGF